MNHVLFEPAELTGEQREWWDDWSQRASNARVRALEKANAGEKVNFEQRIWSELKTWLLRNAFRGKCAYCESKVTDTEWGDADHYRPKGRVVVKRGGKQTIVNRNGTHHPGYFWIAYDWHNVLPSCKRCNTERKLDWFPVANSHVFSPDECSSCAEMDEVEGPLLLSPYRGGDLHPRKHLKFGKRGGVSANRSRMGRVSVDVYCLRRKDLTESRKQAQENAWLRYLDLLKGPAARRKAFVAKFVDGLEEYSAAVADYLLLQIEELEFDRRDMSVDG